MFHRADVRAARLRADGGRTTPPRLVAHAPARTPERSPHHRGVAARATSPDPVTTPGRPVLGGC
eukprot:6370126-Prymnesium_polylepis.1